MSALYLEDIAIKTPLAWKAACAKAGPAAAQTQ
jgi:hypothetical protein